MHTKVMCNVNYQDCDISYKHDCITFQNYEYLDTI